MPTHEVVQPLALRRKQAAKALNLSERRLDQLVAANAIPHFRCGRAVLFPVDRLHEWIAARTVGVADVASQSP
jgi:excisionase family DNA binding protein